MLDDVEADYGDDEAYAEAMQEAVHVSSRLIQPLSTEETKLLDEMGAWADRTSRRADRKVRQLTPGSTNRSAPAVSGRRGG